MALNKVYLVGNLTRDPDVRFLPSGRAVGNMGLAVNRRYKGADGQDKEEVCFVDVAVWGPQATECGDALQKGSRVFVEGRLQYEKWEKDGQKFSRLRVVAERVSRIVSMAPGRQELADGVGPDEGAEVPAPTRRAPPPAARAPAAPEPGAAEAPRGGDEDDLPF